MRGWGDDEPLARRETGTGPYAPGSPETVSHDDVDAQYVKSGALTGSAAEHMLDQVEAATERLLAERLLTDRGFIANSVTPLRS